METIAEFKECPDCKVDSRLMNSVVQKEVEEGNMSKDVVPCARVEVFCNVDPRKHIITGGRLPGARVFRDFCTKCGREFVTRMDVGHVVPPARPDMPPTFL